MQSHIGVMDKDQQFIERLTALGKQILSPDASLWLYGSRARGTAREDSDWDLLILLNKDQREAEDFSKYGAPFTELALDEGEYSIPQIYTRKDWKHFSFSPFVKNVEQDKIVLV